MSIKLIFAHGDNGEFGQEGGLPWDSPEDLKHFKEYTEGCNLLMGSNTFESLPCKLPNRVNIVVGSRRVTAKNGDKPDMQIHWSRQFRSLCLIQDRDICVIGGVGMLNTWIGLASEASVTHVHGTFQDADVFIDNNTIMSILHKRLNEVSTKDIPGATITTFKKGETHGDI